VGIRVLRRMMSVMFRRGVRADELHDCYRPKADDADHARKPRGRSDVRGSTVSISAPESGGPTRPRCPLLAESGSPPQT
jgi:hypothetical protein